MKHSSARHRIEGGQQPAGSPEPGGRWGFSSGRVSSTSPDALSPATMS
jgi:hypothetical protein